MEKLTLVLLPGMDGTGILFEPLLDVLPSSLQPHLVRYPSTRPLGYRALLELVGVGPKWIIRRSRVQEAAERVASGAPVAWAALAQELGYHDQAHLIHDFKAQVGFTPAVYAKRCAASLST